MNILLAGGAGYIGSHTCIELISAGHTVVIADNLCNSKKEAVKRVEKIVGQEIPFYEINVCDYDALRKVFSENKIDAVIHFAGLKAVGESCEKPLMYYRNNLDSTLTLLEVMKEFGCHNFVFSSSATVYGDPAFVPITEECPKGEITNPYGKTKGMLEEILTDIQKADPEWNVILLRYFNPIGAHESGTIGENPNGVPNNLMPYITQVAVGKLKELGVFGNDYDTHDGTCIRDYIHVIDLANAHIKALNYLREGNESNIFNLGSGNGFTVKEMIEAARKVTEHEIPAKVCERRSGDPAKLVASSEKARRELVWYPKYENVEYMISSSWNLHKNHPNGFEK